MHYSAIKNQAKSLRQTGKSIADISNITSISKSTISYWCRDIKLSKNTINKINKEGKNKAVIALMNYAEKNRKERIERYKKNKKEGATMVGKLSERDVLMVGLGLYWGEGYKESNGELGFTNSNPKMIYFYINWLKLFNISKDQLIFRLTINKAFEIKGRAIKSFWIKYLKIKENQFSKTTIIKTNLKKANFKRDDSYRGILRVKVRKGLHLKNIILGAIDNISNNRLN